MLMQISIQAFLQSNKCKALFSELYEIIKQKKKKKYYKFNFTSKITYFKSFLLKFFIIAHHNANMINIIRFNSYFIRQIIFDNRSHNLLWRLCLTNVR